MTTAEIAELLRRIDAGEAFPARIEYALEDLGLIAQTDAPYAQVTKAGRVLIAEMEV